MDWEDVRVREFPVARQWVYLDHAAVAPLPNRAREALKTWADDVGDHGDVHWPRWEQSAEAARVRLAQLINAHPDEIAFVSSTTHGIGLIAEGFPFEAGDNVVSPEEEYPSNIYPWMHLASRGVGLRRVPGRDGRIWIEDLAAAMDARTKVLAISHVEFASGFRNDLDRLGELCRDRGVALFVDAIQGLGPLRIDVERTPIDFLAADGHKWLLGPEGAGLLYVRRSWLDRLRPILVGWHSMVSSGDHSKIDFQFKPSAQRWEGGSYQMPGVQALGAAVALLTELGLDAVSARILDRAVQFRDRAQRQGWRVYGSQRPEDLSGIVSLTHPHLDPRAAVSRLRTEGIVSSCRGGRLRLSPHCYANDADLDRFESALSRLDREPVTA